MVKADQGCVIYYHSERVQAAIRTAVDVERFGRLVTSFLRGQVGQEDPRHGLVCPTLKGDIG